jgi:predicted enzyme related to lactoylglutathione lyase
MERSLKFYNEVLELPLAMRHGDFAAFKTAGATLALHGGADFAAAAGTQRTIVGLTVADYAAAKATLEERGCTFVFENQTPASIFGTFTDPDGTQVQIMQRK